MGKYLNRKVSSRVAQLRSRKNFRRNVWRVVIRAFAWAGFAVLYYTVFSLFFDTPYEFYLKLSTERLRSEYEVLQSRHDSLEMVVSNIEQRDRNVFNLLFESSPYDFEQDEQYSVDIYDSTRGLSTKELLRLFESRCEALEGSCDQLVESTCQMLSSIEQSGKKSAKIPSIQPISNPQLNLLTASFGVRINPFYKALQRHNGVDYTVPVGTRVFATADGVVSKYNLSSSPSGKSVEIDHGNGYKSYYAHLSKIDLPRNKRFKRGDIIGLSGDTGLSLAPHLHYEVRYNGEAVDPLDYFFMELSPSQMQRMRRIAQSGMQAFD